MKKQSNAVAIGVGIVIGSMIFGSEPAYADWPVVDILVDTAVKALQNAAVSAIGQVESAITGMQTSLTQTLDNGFTQEANYSKAQIGAQEQIADASNTAMARFQRDVRNRQIVDEQTPNTQACAAIDNGTAVVVSSGQSWKVATAIEDVSDPRGEAYPGEPAYYGSAQAIQAVNQLHYSRYCSDPESQAGLCTTSPYPNADQRASSLFGTGTFNGQDGVNAANDYVTNLAQPVVPAALRGDQLTSLTGEDGAARRREYNARMSLAHTVLDYVIGTQTPSVPLNAQQLQQMQNEGLPQIQNGSWLQALTLDVERRYSDVNWAGQLQAMPPASVEREIALELAVTNYLLLNNFKVSLMNASAAATTLAIETEKDFPAATPMPTPSMTSN
jgi:hypothetical protein